MAFGDKFKNFVGWDSRGSTQAHRAPGGDTFNPMGEGFRDEDRVTPTQDEEGNLLSFAYDTSFDETTPMNPFKGDVQHAGRQFDSASFDVSDTDQVKNVQQILINEGYDIGGADGMFGPKSEAAYRDWINKTRGQLGGEEYTHADSAGGEVVRPEQSTRDMSGRPSYQVQGSLQQTASDRQVDEQGNPIY